jgi:3-hydroxyisobutyrate dehydrogenase-like beta-hydroxyacid dehydrogenase
VTRWLIVGHGSVGSALSRRIARKGGDVAVYDPAPRVPVADAEYLTAIGSMAHDVVVSCVIPAAAAGALETVRPALGAATLYLEWNTVTPATKKAIAAASPCPVVDVALMDTLDDERSHPSVAISGQQSIEAAALLNGIGFRVDIAGAECGDAALLKLARSLFMKSLEALLIEFEAATALLPGREIIARSVEKNLGPEFTSFSRMLIETDRIHAARRARELQEAVTVFAEAGHTLRVAEASAEVLRGAAETWLARDAPPERAGAELLAEYLARHLREHVPPDVRR